MKIEYTVIWNQNRFTTIWPVKAFGMYHKLDEPQKKLVMFDLEHGERTILSSRGEDNIDKYGLRKLFSLTRERGK